MASSIVVVDALLSDFPIIAMSDQFLRETKYNRKDVLFTNCRFLLENVSGPDVFRISRSSRAAIRAFCQLSRFPRALSGGADQDSQQPNCMQDGQVLMNHFVMRRTYVNGHPMIIGAQHFTQELVAVDSESLGRESEAYLNDIVVRMQKDQVLAELLAHEEAIMCKEPTSPHVCHRAGGRTGPKNTLFYQGSGVLRQEPDTLPNTGIICTATAIDPDTSGAMRFSLRAEEVARWQDYPPMGFTQTEPWRREMLPDFVQYAPCSICFCPIGAICNESDQPLSPFIRPVPLKANPKSLPKLNVNDVLTVELTKDMRLRRFVNGTCVQEVQAPYKPLDKPWYGCFQLSFSVSRAVVMQDECCEQEQRQPEKRRSKGDFASMLEQLVEGFEDVSVTLAMASQELDYPLVAISPGFEQLTGYTTADIVGRNCRFLNAGADMSETNRVGIRTALISGERFTTVLPNLRKDSSPFLNLLDLRTLEVGKQCKSGAPVRLLVGIQGEVDSGRSDAQWRAELPALSVQIQEDIRTRLAGASHVWIMENGDSLEPHSKPFWLDEPMTQPVAGASSPKASPCVNPKGGLFAGKGDTPGAAPGAETRPDEWTPAMVAQFLRSIDLPMYIEAFEAERVDGEVLIDLNEESIADLKVKKIHQKKLLRAIEALRE